MRYKRNRIQWYARRASDGSRRWIIRADGIGRLGYVYAAGRYWGITLHVEDGEDVELGKTIGRDDAISELVGYWEVRRNGT